MYEHNRVKALLEAAIDALVDNFAKQPYVHRCEHSMHCELYSMLAVHRALQGLYTLKGEEYSTSLIHKEWPEYDPREGKGRRGNYDLAILAPAALADATVDHFAKGNIRPAFVVEMGLNYGLDHLKSDDDKLGQSGCEDRYLVHLWQPHRGMRRPGLDDLTAWRSTLGTNVAAAVFGPDGLLVKHLGDPQLRKP